LNGDFPLVRFSLHSPNILRCDYHLLYEGGVTAHAVVDTYEEFSRDCLGALPRLCAGNVIASWLPIPGDLPG
jgi:hypothetical protein